MCAICCCPTLGEMREWLLQQNVDPDDELVHEYISDLEEYESDVTAYGCFCLVLLKAMKGLKRG